MNDNLTNAIAENATGPKKAGGDGISVEQHSLVEQIAAEKFLAAQKATQAKGLGIKLVKLSPGGTA